MSTHIEWLGATNTSVGIAFPGTILGEADVDVDKYAITLSYDELVVIEGTLEELSKLATAIVAAIADPPTFRVTGDEEE
jgi:hypothetical protein